MGHTIPLKLIPHGNLTNYTYALPNRPTFQDQKSFRWSHITMIEAKIENHETSSLCNSRSKVQVYTTFKCFVLLSWLNCPNLAISTNQNCRLIEVGSIPFLEFKFLEEFKLITKLLVDFAKLLVDYIQLYPMFQYIITNSVLIMKAT